MEYVDGRTLRDLLREDRRLLPERAMEITDGTLRALEYSHRNGIVHRDIKPGNVMLTRNGDVKVMDFGIARAVSDAQATMTQTAQVIGTAQYLSPEQARGERVDARSDLYSTGCLLYELLTGRPPFTGDSPVAIAYQHVRENPIPPSRVDPEIPAWADAIVLTAMAKDANDRYQSAAEMHQDIQRALSGMPVAAPTRADMYAGTRAMAPGMMPAGPTSAIPAYRYGPEDQPPGRDGRRRGWLWAIIALVAALVLGGGFYVFHYVSSKGGSISVPAVANRTEAKAEKLIVQANLLVGDVIKQPSDTAKSGHVIKASPAEGTLVPPNSKVTLYVSTGPAQKQVPNVVGKSEQDATQALSQAGFNVGNIKTDSASTQPAWHGDPPVAGRWQPGQAGHLGRPDRIRRRGHGAQRGRREPGPGDIRAQPGRPDLHGRDGPRAARGGAGHGAEPEPGGGCHRAAADPGDAAGDWRDHPVTDSVVAVADGVPVTEPIDASGRPGQQRLAVALVLAAPPADELEPTR